MHVPKPMTQDELERLWPAGDRLQEAHFFLHGLEDYYHFADPFRWHLNAFLRPIKEIPQLISMGLQNRAGFPDWFKSHKAELAGDPLISYLSKQRDFVVHRGMLMPRSSGSLGVTEGRGMKLGMGFPIDPLTDSDDAIRRYLEVATTSSKDFLGILIEDEDSLPCVERHWGLEVFGDADLVDLCAQAWLRVASLLQAVVKELDGPGLTPQLDCLHSSRTVRYRVYDRSDLRAGKIKGIRPR
jgi:hypothetical protein